MACYSGTHSTRYGTGGSENHPNCEFGCQGSCGNACLRGSDNTSCTVCRSDCEAGCGNCNTLCGPQPSCDTLCSGGCTGVCESGCSTGCSGGCSGDCQTGCSGSCSGGCQGTCVSACAQNCAGGCTNSCVGTCNYGCSSDEVNDLYLNLHLSRIAESDDINTIKKIIYRLFENLQKSTIYNKEEYKNEFNNDNPMGLVADWEGWMADGTATFSMLLNKTFEAIIQNLNTLNKGRIEIDQNKMTPVKIWKDPVSDEQLSTVDRDAALYWIECLKKIYEQVMPVK